MVPLKYALDWPVFASYDELAGCASWMGGRIPTFDEARSLYEHVRCLKKEEAERKLGKTVPAVNGYVSPTPDSRRQLRFAIIRSTRGGKVIKTKAISSDTSSMLLTVG